MELMKIGGICILLGLFLSPVNVALPSYSDKIAHLIIWCIVTYKYPRNWIIVALLSVIIECVQPLFNRGFEILDVVFNLLGIISYFLTSKLYKMFGLTISMPF